SVRLLCESEAAEEDEGKAPVAVPAPCRRAQAPSLCRARSKHLVAWSCLQLDCAARPSGYSVPLAPIAPMILPFTIIGTPPSDATGLSGKVVNARLPAAY